MALAFAMAPIAAAIAQVESEKVRSAADVEIAQTSANAALQQAQLQTATQLQLAENQRQVAENNTRTTFQLAQMQQQSQTQQFQAQLQANQAADRALAEERASVRAIEQQRADQQIALARENAAQQLALTQQSINAQLVSQSLSVTGAGRLSIANNQATASNGAVTTANNPFANTGDSAVGFRASSSARGFSGGSNTSNPRTGSSRLLASVSNSRAVEGANPLLAAVRSSANDSAFGGGFQYNEGSSRGLRGANLRGVKPINRGSRLALVSGSTRGFHQRIGKPSNSSASDLTQFRVEVQDQRRQEIGGAHSSRPSGAHGFHSH